MNVFSDIFYKSSKVNIDTFFQFVKENWSKKPRYKPTKFSIVLLFLLYSSTTNSSFTNHYNVQCRPPKKTYRKYKF